MNISDYRAQFASFNSALELARYGRHVGVPAELDDNEIYGRYGDLFSQATVADLQSHREQTPLAYETERSGLGRLLGAARFWHVEMQTSESGKELAHCESTSRIEWNGEEIALADVPARLARESNKKQRAELGSRWAGSVSICDEVRTARLSSFGEVSRALGFSSYGALIAEATNAKVDSGGLVAHTLLEQTESAYTAAFARLVGRGFPDEPPGDLDFADLPYFESMPWLGKSLSPRDPLQTYADTMRGLGIQVDKQPNIQIDLTPRPSRNSAATCFPVSPPKVVRLSASPLDGAADFLGFLQQAGKAQHHAWCSKDLARRHPEFVYSVDSATNEGYGYLFYCLALEPRWLLEFLRDIDEVQASRIARDVALQLALRVRRLCADASYIPQLHGEGQASREQLQAAYVDSQERATSFHVLPELFLLDLHERMAPQCHLRALAFSFALREYLRVRYGSRWWASRKAGDELIDLWNTASQYSVEELARLIDFGELDFDLLAEAMVRALKGA